MYYDTNTGRMEGTGGQLADGSWRDFRAYVQNTPQYSQYLDFVGNDGDFQGGGGINEAKLREYSAGPTGSATDDQNSYQNAYNTIMGAWNNYSGTGSTLGSSTYGTGSSGSSTPVSNWTSQDQGIYDQSVGQINNNLGRMPGLLNTAYGNIESSFGQKDNELKSGLNQAQSNFKQGQTQNQQQRVTSSNLVNQQSQAGLRGLLRQIAAMGGGGGSAYMYSAPEVVGETAQQDLSGVGQTFAGNQRSLTSNFDQYRTQNEQERTKLGDWRNQQRQEAQSQSLTGENTLRNTLMQLAAQRAQAMGGDTRASMQPYIDQINTTQNQIDGLQRFQPQYSGNTPVYQAPELSRFSLRDNPQIQANMQNARGGATPYLNLLLGNREEETRLA